MGIDRIEVIRGPGGVIWDPNAVDGVINVITKSSKDSQGLLVMTRGGDVNLGNVTVRYGGGNGRDFTYRVYAKAFADAHESTATITRMALGANRLSHGVERRRPRGFYSAG